MRYGIRAITSGLLPIYNFPATKFAYENNPADQLNHVLSEVDEVLEASDVALTWLDDDLLEELTDLSHSLETFWRTVELVTGREAVQALFTKVADKNLDRGYYDVGTRADLWGDR